MNISMVFLVLLLAGGYLLPNAALAQPCEPQCEIDIKPNGECEGDVAVCVFGNSDAWGVAASGSGESESEILAVSIDGDAWASSTPAAVAVAGAGNAWADHVAVAALGDSSGGIVAVSGAGSANGGLVAVSATCYASGEVAVGLGNIINQCI